MEYKRLKDYLAAMAAEDYEAFFADIEEEEDELRAFLTAIDGMDESILPQVAEVLNDAWRLPYEHATVIDFIVDLYKCELTRFHDGGALEYMGTIKDILRDELDMGNDEEPAELLEEF